MDGYKIVFEKMRLLMESASQEAQKYCLIFKKEDFFTFSDAKKRSAEYKREYFNFIIKITEIFTHLGDCMTQITSYLLEADREADEIRILILNSVFEKYLILEKELYIFTDTTEKEFNKDVVSVSIISDCASRLLISLNSFKDCLI